MKRDLTAETESSTVLSKADDFYELQMPRPSPFYTVHCNPISANQCMQPVTHGLWA